MNPKFIFSAEQLELLSAVESADSLLDLSHILRKDMSVISRNLQRLSEVAPVIQKVNRKWEITDLGLKVNLESSKFISTITALTELRSEKPVQKNIFVQETMALILINTQKALEDRVNNADVIRNIQKILEF